MRPIKKTPQPKENQISENHSVVAIGASAPQPHADRWAKLRKDKTMKRIEDIADKMRTRTTEDLTAIWTKNDRKEWSDDAFDAINMVLTERGISVPVQQAVPIPQETARAVAKSKPRLPLLGGVARWVSLVLATFGVLGWSQTASHANAGNNMTPWIIAFVVGVVTVNSLRRPFLRIPATILNAGLIILGIWLILTATVAVSPEMRRIWGGFCLLAGCANLAGIRSVSRQVIS